MRPRVDSNFVTLSVDHRPVCVDVCARLIDSVPPPKRPGLPRHTDGLRPDGLCRMRLALWVMPPVAWAVNVHEHTAYVYEAARTGAREAGLFQTARRTRSFVSDEAASLLQAVKQCRCRLRQLDRLARKLRLRELFCAWRGDGRVALSREGWSLSEVHKRTALCIAELDAFMRKLRSRIR